MINYLTIKINKFMNISKSKLITKTLIIILMFLMVIYMFDCISKNNNYKIQFIEKL
jgi:hypothetical protein